MKRMFEYLVERIVYWVKECIYHTPTHMLDKKEMKQVMQYGLIHFCEGKNIESIKDSGVMGGLRKPMRKREKNFTWFYINLDENFEKNKKIVHSKGHRKNYNAYVIVNKLSEEQLKLLRIRKEVDDAVIYPGTLKTNDIEGFKL